VSQTGDLVRYTVTATNTGDVAVDKLFVIDLVPDEVDVVSAPISPVVLATELGRHRGHEDVVWNVGSLAAGRSIDLVWTGRVAHAGDMRAVNVGVAKAAAGAVKARTATTTYVATAATPATNNPPFAPRSRRVAVEGAALARPFEAPAGAVIPFTGFDAVPWLLIAAGLAVAGAGIFATALTVPSGGPARRVDPKLLATTLGLAALLVTACTSAPTGPEAGGASPSVTGGIQVKGKVVTRRAQPSPTAATSPAPASPQAGGATTPTPETAPSPGASPTLTSPVAAVAPAAPTVKVVHIGLTDLPVAHLGSKGGDNALDYAWDENAGSIVHASSSLSFVRDEKVQLLSSLHPVHGRIVVDATIVNDSGMRRLAVDGRIRHGIVSGSRTVATLRSAPIHVVLAPHGSTSVRFSYALPTGDYSVISSFLSE
jgi:uncharacterized repeat protein (TIGR01451 family)